MSIERELRTNWDTVYYPEPEPVVEQAMAPGQQPGDVLVAEAGSRGLPDQAYSGRYPDTIKPFDPTIRQRLSDFLQAGFEGLGVDRYKARQNAQTLIGGPSSNLPLTMGLADVVPFLGTAMQTEEAAIMGGEAVESAKQGNYGTAALQAGGAALGMIPGAVGTVKAAKALPKNLPVGLSTQTVGGMDNVLTPPIKAAAPVNDIGFYSAVEQAALNIQRKSGTGQAMLNDITKGENVKADEIKWIGLDDFLKGKKNVTKEDVQNFIAENKIDLKEVTLGGAEPFDAQRLTQLESEYKSLKDHPIDDPSFGQEKYDEMIRLMNIRDQSTTQTLYDAADQAMSSAQRAQRQGNNITAEKYFREAELLNTRAEKLDLQGQGMSNPPKFGQYTLPGGENYREILLTLPEKTPSIYPDFDTYFRAKYSDYANPSNPAYAMAQKDARRNWDAMGGKIAIDDYSGGKVGLSTGNYLSSHFDEPNILAHIRVNDRVDADGKKMLLIEEIQSDWHQAGREKGYRKQGQPERLKGEAYQLPDGTYGVKWEDGSVANLGWGKANAERLANEGKLTGDVPDAPFKDTWYQLALKRALRYAADNGYDRVGLTTGKQQAERYDLSKQISKVYYSPPDSKQANKFGTVLKAFDKRGNEVINKSVMPDQLPDYIGKEVANKLLESNGNSMGVKSLDGIDLQVGGEGMKKYYDEIYPKFLDKYGKKWGASVGETRIKTDRGVPGGEPVRYLDITPEMRKSVQKGQPLAAVSGETTVA